ncbi:MAG: DEAD/DEAH box helicase family protein, partial [Bacteroidetes bacterium]|nr:DEAD/DEAH box helicase family protein [Bacteroidota bacterium]
MAKLKDEITYADVILPLPVKGRFSYEVPEKLMENNLVGKRVLVQFGKRKLYAGLISNVYAEKPQGYTVKPILDIIDTKPLVDENLLSFWEWIADYYLCEIGEVMNAGLPASLKLSSETKVRLNPFFENHESVVSTELSRKQSLVIESIGYRKSLTMAQLQDVLEQKTIYPVINELIDQDILEISESIKESYSPKKVSFVQLKPELKDTTVLEETMDRLEKAPKQLALFMACLELDIEEEPIRKSYLFGKVGKEESALKGLVKNDVVEIVQKEVSRLELDEEPKDLKFELADEQQKALEEIKKHFKNKNVVLLHGVTSSGKTYIYIRLIEEILRKKEQVLYLLPEIALTTQIINKLRAYFGNIVGVYHSKYNAKEKVEIWNKVLKQEYKIIIGARSAVFLPF